MTSHEILNMIDNLKTRIKDKEYKELVEKLAELNKEEQDKKEEYVQFNTLKIIHTKTVHENSEDEDDERDRGVKMFMRTEYVPGKQIFKIVEDVSCIERNIINKRRLALIKRSLERTGSYVLRECTCECDKENIHIFNFNCTSWGGYSDTDVIITGIVE